VQVGEYAAALKNGEITNAKHDKKVTQLSVRYRLSQWLIRQKLISTVPWDDVESAIRFSVTFAAKDETDEDRVINEITSRLSDVNFEFQTPALGQAASELYLARGWLSSSTTTIRSPSTSFSILAS
jgi:hypothetical protein